MSAQQQIELPPPRMWHKQHLADFLDVSVSWVEKRLERKAENPIPRVPGMYQVRFDTQSPAFQSWMREFLGYVDEGEASE
jgi:hypothetical protein